MSTIDVGGAVRRGEELDIEKVDQWLKEQNIVLKGMPQITQYSGGASNWTYRIQYENRDLILRRPPAGTKAKSAHDMQREYNVQKHLSHSIHWCRIWWRYALIQILLVAIFM